MSEVIQSVKWVYYAKIRHFYKIIDIHPLLIVCLQYNKIIIIIRGLLEYLHISQFLLLVY